jgi:membrane protease YdiL (CAAX protease family)
MTVILWAVLTGMAVLLAGTIPRNVLFGINIKYHAEIPWAVPVIALWLWLFWRYLGGSGPPQSTAESRRQRLSANRLPGRVWGWALLAGGLGIVALVLGLQIANRLVLLPEQHLSEFSQVPRLTLLTLLLVSAPIAGIVEEASFRGYMQGPIAKQFGPVLAILISGTMFAVAHLDFTPILWPYYLAVAAVYGTVTHLTGSILPAVVLHAGGNVYSNLDLWLHGQAEWQAPAGAHALVWETGPDRSFWLGVVGFLVVCAAMTMAFRVLARTTGEDSSGPPA